MIASLVQFDDGARGVAAMTSDGARRVIGVSTVLELAELAVQSEIGLAALAETRLGDPVDLASVRLLVPIDHADDAHLVVTGTGLTHLGSAEGRDQMHRKAAETPTRPIR